MKIFVAHSSDFDFKNKLYKPLRESALNNKNEFILPQENGKEQITKNIIKNCNVVLAEVSLPSTGQGIELGWADIFNIPIVCIQEKNSNRSGSLGFITDIFIEYENPDDMVEKITKILKSI